VKKEIHLQRRRTKMKKPELVEREERGNDGEEGKK